jgi:hypothetical protein
LQCKQRGHACGNLLTRARRSPARNRILKNLRQRALSFRALEVQYFVLAHSVQNFRMNPAGYGDTFPPMTTGLICLPQLRFSQYKTRSMLLMFLLKIMHYQSTTNIEITSRFFS